MASPRQVLLQIETALKAVTWPTSPSDKVFGEQVHISPGPFDPENDPMPARLPFVFLGPVDDRPDDEEADLVEQVFSAFVVCHVDGGDFGRRFLVGGPSSKTPRRAYSQGRGLMELEQALYGEDMRLRTSADGTPILVEPSGAPVPAIHKGRRVLFREYGFRAFCTRSEEWPAPSRLAATGGVGQIDLTWSLPPSRYDLDSIVVRYTTGATAPASESAGTGWTLGSDLPTSTTITGLSADTYSVAIFARYVEGQEADDVHSSQVTGTTRTSITVT